jgi:hypothetical protein
MNLVNVAALVRKIASLIVQFDLTQIWKVRIETPLPVEGNKWVCYSAVAPGYQNLLRAVGMQQHQIGAGIESGGMKNFRPDGVGGIPVPGLADVHDVIMDGCGQFGCCH